MKRCPQCEFIYEDDQSLCDMDGVLLVLDTRNLPNLHALAKLPEKTQRRNRAVPAFATVILAFVLGTVYYVSTQRPTVAPEIPQVPVAATEPAPSSEPVEQPAATTEAEDTEEKEESKSTSTKQTTNKKPTAKNSSSHQTKTSTADKKEDSKVGSVLKKTGRILKKPFKF